MEDYKSKLENGKYEEITSKISYENMMDVVLPLMNKHLDAPIINVISEMTGLKLALQKFWNISVEASEEFVTDYANAVAKDFSDNIFEKRRR